MKKSIYLSDFSPETQVFLKEFGLTQETDLKADFDVYRNKIGLTDEALKNNSSNKQQK